MDCRVWPKPEKDLDVLQVFGGVLSSKQQGFVAVHRTRSGGKAFYKATPEEVDDLRETDLESIELGAQYSLVAVHMDAGELWALFITYPEDKAQLTLVDLNKGRKYDLDMPLPGIGDIQFTRNSEGFWVSYRELSEDVALEEQPLKLLWINGQKLETKVKPVAVTAAEKIVGNYRLLSHAPNNATEVVYLDRGTGVHSSQPQFKVATLDAKAMKATSGTLTLKINEQVEQWQATAHNGKLYLAFMDGDSLMGNGELKAAEIDHAKVTWLKGLPLKHIHYSQPQWIQTGNSLSLGALKWLDRESTFAWIGMDGKSLEERASIGVFPEASVLESTFASTEDGQKMTHAVLRVKSRNTTIPELRICTFAL